FILLGQMLLNCSFLSIILLHRIIGFNLNYLMLLQLICLLFLYIIVEKKYPM
ncbi:TPA: glycosyl transferase, partial [Legionella pneumophila]|nr:glycosyl transferase [Legionella pneumophila]